MEAQGRRLEVAESCFGHGLFVENGDDNDEDEVEASEQSPAEVVLSLPQTAVLNCAKALASPLGRACTALFSDDDDDLRVPPLFVLQLWMAVSFESQALREKCRFYFLKMPRERPSIELAFASGLGDSEFSLSLFVPTFCCRLGDETPPTRSTSTWRAFPAKPQTPVPGHAAFGPQPLRALG